MNIAGVTTKCPTVFAAVTIATPAGHPRTPHLRIGVAAGHRLSHIDHAAVGFHAAVTIAAVRDGNR